MTSSEHVLPPNQDLNSYFTTSLLSVFAIGQGFTVISKIFVCFCSIIK